jgi:hypothetical protein
MSKKLQRGNKEVKKPKKVPGVVIKPGGPASGTPAVVPASTPTPGKK